MKFTIRQNIWETNSSSMHSIAVMKNKGQYTPEEMMNDMYIHKGVWKIYDSDLDFGRYPFQILTSFSDKLKYVIAEYAGSYRPYKDGEKFIDEILLPIITKYIPECYDINFPKKYVTVYNDQDGNGLDIDDVYYHDFKSDSSNTYECCAAYEKDGIWYKAIKTNEEWKYPDFGQVDHQSAGLLKGFIEKEGITLEDFLVNRQYIIVIDGDEYCDWNKYKTVGIINVAGIDHEFPPENNEYGQLSMDSYIYFKEKENEEND